LPKKWDDKYKASALKLAAKNAVKSGVLLFVKVSWGSNVAYGRVPYQVTLKHVMMELLVFCYGQELLDTKRNLSDLAIFATLKSMTPSLVEEGQWVSSEPIASDVTMDRVLKQNSTTDNHYPNSLEFRIEGFDYPRVPPFCDPEFKETPINTATAGAASAAATTSCGKVRVMQICFVKSHV